MVKVSKSNENLRNELFVLSNKFIKYLRLKFKFTRISNKLENWQDLHFDEFIKELNKAIKATNKVRVEENKEPVSILSKTDEFEWLDLFEQNKKKAQNLKMQIDAIEQQIDTMVYELYELSDEEIRIIENA